MSDVIGLLGIIVAFFIVIYFTYKGFQLAYVVMVACIVVIVTNSMPLIQTFNETIMPQVGTQPCYRFICSAPFLEKCLLIPAQQIRYRGFY